VSADGLVVFSGNWSCCLLSFRLLVFPHTFM
jgi:hypothetical protein